jgi:peptidoglycan/xylan/chitin deacetylase (PgdA/CDA1 family)
VKPRSRGLAAIAFALVVLASGCGSQPPHRAGTEAGPASPTSPTVPGAPPVVSTTSRPPAAPAQTQPQTRPPSPTRQHLLIRPLIAGRIIERLPTSHKVVALTFDAGANDAGVAKILATLDATGATGTFFITGRWAKLYPEWVRRTAARYPIGNHTYDHPDLLTLSPGAVTREIRRAEAELTSIVGQRTEPLFRFPYGSSNTETLRAVNELGYTAIGWTADTLGWEGTTGGQTAGTIITHALDHLQPGEIILMHVGSNPNDKTTLDADSLRAIIDAIRTRGYTFVTIPRALQP